MSRAARRRANVCQGQTRQQMYRLRCHMRVFARLSASLKKLGHVIRFERLKIGLSQEELGERCGSHRTRIGAIERGESNITVQNVERIASALNARVWMLLRAAEESAASS